MLQVPRTKFLSHLLFLRLSPSDGAVNSCHTPLWPFFLNIIEKTRKREFDAITFRAYRWANGSNPSRPSLDKGQCRVHPVLKSWKWCTSELVNFPRLTVLKTWPTNVMVPKTQKQSWHMLIRQFAQPKRFLRKKHTTSRGHVDLPSGVRSAALKCNLARVIFFFWRKSAIWEFFSLAPPSVVNTSRPT